jgi:hypothetical protein
MGIFLAALAAAGDAGVQSMNQNIDQQNRSDLEIQRSELATQKEKALTDYNNQAKINSDNQVRKARSDEVSDGAQKLAQLRADVANQNAQDQGDAAENAYANAPGLSDSDRRAGIMASRQYTKDNTTSGKAVATDDDTLHASVNAGYTSPMELLAMKKQDALAKSQAMMADIKERHEDNNVQRTIQAGEQNANWMKVMMARIEADKSSGSDSEDTAAIKTAKVIQADEKGRGNDISLAEAIDRTHKAADAGNNFALNYAKLQSEAGMIRPDKGDPTKPAPGKLYATVDDAIAAGQKAFINPRATSKPSAIANPAPAPTTRPPLSSFGK